MLTAIHTNSFIGAESNRSLSFGNNESEESSSSPSRGGLVIGIEFNEGKRYSTNTTLELVSAPEIELRVKFRNLRCA